MDRGAWWATVRGVTKSWAWRRVGLTHSHSGSCIWSCHWFSNGYFIAHLSILGFFFSLAASQGQNIGKLDSHSLCPGIAPSLALADSFEVFPWNSGLFLFPWVLIQLVKVLFRELPTLNFSHLSLKHYFWIMMCSFWLFSAASQNFSLCVQKFWLLIRLSLTRLIRADLQI